MLKDIVTAKAFGDYRLHLQFEDCVEGVVNLEPHLSFRGVPSTAAKQALKASHKESDCRCDSVIIVDLPVVLGVFIGMRYPNA